MAVIATGRTFKYATLQEVKRLLRPSGLALLILCATLSIIFREAIWNRSSTFLIVSDSPVKSDIIFLLGGDYMLRAPYAAQLYREGYAPKILIAREPIRRGTTVVDFSGDTIRALENAGVPKGSIVNFSPSRGVTSTADEARALRIYVDVYPVHSVLVVTSMMHGRRARLAIQRALRGKGIRVLVVSAGPPTYTPDQRARAREEMLKLIYYFFAFWG